MTIEVTEVCFHHDALFMILMAMRLKISFSIYGAVPGFMFVGKATTDT